MVEASKIEQDKKKDGAQGDRPRFERLRHIELEIQEQIEAGKLNEVSAPADYEKMDWV